ncbi:MAG: S41 family peptidase [Mucinivorans sp.]
MKRGTIILTAICSLIVGAISGIIIDRSQVARFAAGVSGRGDKLNATIGLLEQRYVDSLSRDSLSELVIPLLLGSLDPHSEYIPASQLKEVNEPLEGKFDGIGVVFNMATDTAQILNVIAGGPSAKVGLTAGDRIMMVDTSHVAGVKLDQTKMVKMLRGDKGTKVTLYVKRGQNKKLLPFTVTRGQIPINSLEGSMMLPNKSAYIRLSRFAASTHVEVMNAIGHLVAQGATSVTLDLRGNGGGYLDQALYLANEFLPKGAMIVYIQGAHKSREEQYADGSGCYQNMPLTVLVDETSASSSEIFAGAMQDNDRARLIGRRTFGKGLIQDQVNYTDGSAARITIARYYTPLGRPLQKPYTMGDRASYDKDMLNRYEHGEFSSADSVRQNDSLKVFLTAGGKKLYGGGGITPDIFVPIEGKKASPYFLKLYQANLVFKFAQQYADRYRAAINAINDFQALDRFFVDKGALYNEFVDFASREGVKPSASEMAADRKLITAQLKAFVSRNTPLQESAFYYYIWPFDPAIVLSNGDL